MLTPETAKERIFCPHCGRPGAFDCTGEGDWTCLNEACGHKDKLIRPLFERDLQGAELLRLRLENEQLRNLIHAHVDLRIKLPGEK